MALYEFLVKNRDSILPAGKDPKLDRQGCRKRGYVVAHFLSPHQWGNLECLPTFVVIKCDLQSSDLEAYEGLRKAWRDDFAYEVLSSNAQQGRYTVRVYEQNAGASNQNGLTAAKVERFLEGWGCTNISFTTNSCTFTFSLWNAVRSPKFWNVPLIGTKATFDLVSYNATSGIGRVQVTITDENIKVQEVKQRIEERGGTIISADYPVGVFEIERSDILQRFRDDVKHKAENVYMMQQHRINEATMDAAVAAGGTLTLTRAQLLAAIRDMAAE